MNEEQESGDASFVLGLLVGAAVGAALAVILTPKSGQAVQEAIREKGLVLRDRVQETADAVRRTATNAAESAQATAEETRDAVVTHIQAPDSTSAGA